MTGPVYCGGCGVCAVCKAIAAPARCAHDFEVAYIRRHPGKVAECPACPAIFVNGQERKCPTS